MKELVKRIVQMMVDFPEEVDIKESEGLNTRILEIRVSEKDVGKLLGRKGRNITALRNIVSAAGKGKNHYVIEVLEERPFELECHIYKGKIKRLFGGRDYGFIEVETGRTIFFHASSLQGVGIRSLSLNQPVEFEIEEGPKGIRAVRVVPPIGKDFQSQ
jgi:predicted RNA-binding protein YlqC (UPF0109 family)/cold shock CspA family protein